MAKQSEREEQADFPIHPNTYYTDRYLAGRYQTSRQAPWQWAKNGIFPKPVKLSPQCSRWYGQAVLDYEAKLAEAQV